MFTLFALSQSTLYTTLQLLSDSMKKHKSYDDVDKASVYYNKNSPTCVINVIWKKSIHLNHLKSWRQQLAFFFLDSDYKVMNSCH